MQHPAWPDLARASRLQSFCHFLCEDEDGEVVSAGLVRITRIMPGRCFAAIRRGPATRRPEDLPAVLALLEARLRGLGAIVLAVGPSWSGKEAAEVTGSLERAGYRRVPAIEQTLPTATAIIDLTRSPRNSGPGCRSAAAGSCGNARNIASRCARSHRRTRRRR